MGLATPDRNPSAYTLQRLFATVEGVIFLLAGAIFWLPGPFVFSPRCQTDPATTPIWAFRGVSGDRAMLRKVCSPVMLFAPQFAFIQFNYLLFPPKGQHPRYSAGLECRVLVVELQLIGPAANDTLPAEVIPSRLSALSHPTGLIFTTFVRVLDHPRRILQRPESAEMAAGESHRTLSPCRLLRFSGPLGEPTPAPAIMVSGEGFEPITVLILNQVPPTVGLTGQSRVVRLVGVEPTLTGA